MVSPGAAVERRSKSTAAGSTAPIRCAPANPGDHPTDDLPPNALSFPFSAPWLHASNDRQLKIIFLGLTCAATGPGAQGMRGDGGWVLEWFEWLPSLPSGELARPPRFWVAERSEPRCSPRNAACAASFPPPMLCGSHVRSYSMTFFKCGAEVVGRTSRPSSALPEWESGETGRSGWGEGAGAGADGGDEKSFLADMSLQGFALNTPKVLKSKSSTTSLGCC